MSTSLAAVGTALLILAISTSAGADDKRDRPAAQALFKQGLALVKQGNFSEGCPKFEAALELWPSASTALNLGRCHEHFQRTASAWSAYHRAKSLAGENEGPARSRKLVARASAAIAAIEPQLAKLNIIIDSPQALPAELSITRDGVEYPAKSLGAAIPIDPGTSTVRIAASGYRPFERTIKTYAGETVELRAELQPATATVQADDSRSDIPIWAWISGAGGLAAGAISIAFLVDDLDAIADLEANCDETVSPARCTPGYDVAADNRRKNRSLGLSIGFGAAGAIALTTAIVGIVLSSTHDDDAPVRASGFLTPLGDGRWSGGALLEGRF